MRWLIFIFFGEFRDRPLFSLILLPQKKFYIEFFAANSGKQFPEVIKSFSSLFQGFRNVRITDRFGNFIR